MKKITIALALLLSAVAAAPSAQAAKAWTSYKIMLDPGHGGTDPGASGPSAPHEGTLALRCAKALNTKITASPLSGTVKLTRTTDTYVTLTSRKQMSVSYDPYIFCSIHLNAFNGSAHGTETWYYWTTGNSLKLANKVHAQLIAQVGRTNRGVKKNGWTVITGSSSVPAILTEGLFVDNKEEWGLINTEDKTGFKNWVNGHLYGFYDHFKSNLGYDVVNPQSSSGSSDPDPEPDPTTPTLTVSTTELHFECFQDEHPTMTFTVKGADLSNTISVSSYAPGTFEPSVTSLAATGGSVTVTFKNSSRVGSYNQDDNTTPYKIAVQCGSLRQEVKISALVKAKPLNAMTEVWNLSEKRSTKEQKGYDASAIRNFCYNEGKLYCVYNHTEIKVINAATGEDLGNLNKGSICGGGALTFCDVKCIDGHIIACNLATTGSELRLYCWDNDQSEPYLLYNTTDFQGAARIGDCMEMRGSFTGDMYIDFGNDDNTTTRIIEFIRKSGKTWSSRSYTATTDGSTHLSTQGTTRVYPQSDGWWIDGKDSYPSWMTLNTSNVAVRQTYVDTGETWGSSHHEFTWAGNKYSANIVFNGKEYKSDGTMNSDANYKGARARLIYDPTGDFTRMEQIADYPSDGLGDTSRNTNATADAIVKTDGSTWAQLWVLSTTHGMAYFSYGTPPTYTVNPITQLSPSIAASATKIDLAATAGSSATAKVTFTGSALTDDITLTLSGADADMFKLSSTTIAKSAASATITVTYTPSAAGTHSATITAKSSGASNVTVGLTGTGSLSTTFVDEINNLECLWEYSAQAGNSASASWLSLTDNYTRDVAANGEKLYVLNCKAWGTPSIAIVNGQTGASLGSVSVEGVSGGAVAIGGIAVIGGKLIASNSARTTSHTLKIYKWDSDTAAPTVWMEDSSHEGISVGDQLNVTGDLTNGAILVTNGSKVLRYAITNGNVNSTPTVVTLSKSAGEMNGSADVVMLSDGTMWITGREVFPTHYTADGTLIESLQDTAFGSGYNNTKSGTAATVIPFGSRTYLAGITYVGTSNSLLNGAIALVDLTAGVEAATAPVGIYPSAGLGTTRNTQFQTAVDYSLSDNGHTLTVFGAVPYQGAAAFTYKGDKTTGIDNVIAVAKSMAINVAGRTISVSGDVARIEVYTIAGAIASSTVENVLDATDLPTGVYIVRAIDRRGNSVAKKVALTR